MAAATAADRGGNRSERTSRGGPAGLIADFRLDNGARVVLEPMRHVRTASIGIWFPVGSRDDPAGAAGLAHFLEHLVFKGSRRRSGRALAEAMDALGGQFNAFTTREHTCFHAHVLARHLPEAIELLAEMVVAPRLDAEDAERERQVILDELAMLADDPVEAADALWARSLWGAQALGRPLAGDPDSVAGLSAARVRRFHRAHYCGARAVVVVAGSLDPERLRVVLPPLLGPLPAGAPAGPRPPARARPRPLRRVRAGEQAHLIFGTAGPAQGAPDRFAAALWASIVGGSPSSRLFQALREGEGLCYDVGASRSEYGDAGEIVCWLSASPEDARRAAEIAVDTIRELAASGPTPEEVERHARQLQAGVWMDLEGPDVRMQGLGRWAVSGDGWLAPGEVSARLRALRPAHVRAFAVGLGDPADWAAAYLGPPGAAPGPWRWREG